MDFKDWFSFNEMPMANYNIGHINKDVPQKLGSIPVGGFTSQDRKAMYNPVWVKKLGDVLSRTSKYNFNIILMERKRPDPKSSEGKNQRDFFEEVEQFIKEKNIPTEGHITYVKNSTTGHALTPWMLLHTIGHAVFNQEQHIYKQAKEVMHSLYIDHVKSHNFLRSSEASLFQYDTPVSFLKRLFLFKSAQNAEKGHEDRSLVDFSELIYELVAEYLWHGGKIRWQMPEEIPNANPHDVNSANVKMSEEMVARHIRTLESEIDRALTACVGKVIYDYYGTEVGYL